MYKDEIQSALKLTRELNVNCESVDRFENAILRGSKTDQQQVGRFLEVYNPPFEMRCGNCTGMHTGPLLNAVAARWQALPVVTIGNVLVEGKPRYKGDKDYAVRQTLGDDEDQAFHLHAWWTFPDMQIVDLSLGHVLANEGVTLGGRLTEGIDIFQNADILRPVLEYKPIVLGEKYLAKANAIDPTFVLEINSLYGKGY